MTGIIVLLIIGGGIYGLVVWQQKSTRENATAAAAGRLMHLRDGQYPATCSWCKNTGVARKLMVFERVDESWRPFEVGTGLAAVPDPSLEDTVAAMFKQSHPGWRRFCTEKCAREFLAAEHVEVATAFGPCAYCSTRFPMLLVHCPQCAAPRKAA